MATPLHLAVLDSRWSTLEVCMESERNKYTRPQRHVNIRQAGCLYSLQDEVTVESQKMEFHSARVRNAVKAVQHTLDSTNSMSEHVLTKRNTSGKTVLVTTLLNKLLDLLNGTMETASEIMSLLARKCPELFPDLKRKPTEKDPLAIAEAIGDNYRIFGLALGLTDVNLDQISLDNQSVVMKTFKMLTKWSDNNPLKSSVSSLIQTLKTCSSGRVDWNQIGKLCI